MLPGKGCSAFSEPRGREALTPARDAVSREGTEGRSARRGAARPPARPGKRCRRGLQPRCCPPAAEHPHSGAVTPTSVGKAAPAVFGNGRGWEGTCWQTRNQLRGCCSPEPGNPGRAAAPPPRGAPRGPARGDPAAPGPLLCSAGLEPGLLH